MQACRPNDAWAEPSTSASLHPLLSLEALRSAASRQASSASSSQRAAHLRVWRSLEAKKHVSIIALGGSMVAGMGCSEASRSHTPEGAAYFSLDSKAMAECSFPSIFVRSLRRALCIPDAKLLYSNRAAGGTSTKGVLPQLPLLLDDSGSGGRSGGGGPDLLVIDYSANDWADEVIQKSESGTYKRCNATDAEEGACSGSQVSHADVRNSTSAAATEILLSYVLATRPATAVILVEADCHALISRVAHERIARHHGVPYVAYVDALQSNATMAGPRYMGSGFRVCRKSTKAWQSTTSILHPKQPTHALISTCVEQWWRHFLQNLRASGMPPVAAPPRAPLTFAVKRQELGGICEPRSLYDAKQLLADRLLVEPARTGGSSGPWDATWGFRVLEGNWSIYEDRPGKPGFITTGPANSTLDFEVSFGATPCVSMVYERSYEGFGTVHATLLNNSQMPTAGRTQRNMWLTISGQRDDGMRVTQADTLFMNNHPLVTKWRAEPFTNRTLRLRYVSDPPLKFKVRFLSSC